MASSGTAVSAWTMTLAFGPCTATSAYRSLEFTTATSPAAVALATIQA